MYVSELNTLLDEYHRWNILFTLRGQKAVLIEQY